MNRYYLLIAGLLLILFSGSAKASHILGGEIRMETTADPTRFSFSMIQFWDQDRLTVANREPSVEILFYRKRDNQLIFRTSLPYKSSRNVNYQNQVCSGMKSLKTVEGTYNATVEVNPGEFSDPGGYYIVWERCCRNAEISNIRQPGGSGLVFYLEFPPLSVRNSSPVFNFPNGDYICQGLPYSTNLSATDADGDELRYSLVTPFRGNTNLDDPIGNDSPKQGYPLVEWIPGISEQNMIPGNPGLNINAQTGKLTVTASQLGLFVFTVQCEEFRNGVRIGIVRRDFQSLVIECNPNLPPTPIVLYQKQPTPRIEFCGQTTTLEVAEAGDWAYQWQLNDQDIAGATQPSLTIDRRGSYTVLRLPKNSGQDQCSIPAASTAVEVIEGLSSAVISKSSELICAGSAISLRATQNDSYVYEWRKGMNKLNESGAVLSVAEAGVYHLTVRNKNNTCAASDSVEIKSESVQVGLPTQVEILRGQSVQLDPMVSSTGSTVTYQWSPSNGLSDSQIAQPLASPSQTTDYILLAKTLGGCQSSAGIKVTVNECREVPIPIPVVTFGGQASQRVELCLGRVVTLVTDQAGDWSYQWQYNGQPISGATGSTFEASRTGRYTVVRSANNVVPDICMKPATSSPVEVVNGRAPIAKIISTGTILCAGSTLILNAGNAESAQYRWISPVPSLSDTSAQLEVNRGGWYRLEIVNMANGCLATDSIFINEELIGVELPVEVWVKRGEAVTLRPMLTVTEFPVKYLWTPSMGLSSTTDSLPIAQPEETTDYLLVVETPGGCQANASTRVSIIDRLFLPDAFSPNGDGHNDVLVISNGSALIESIKIYNRWGQVIFSESGYDIPWDGYFLNRVVENGIYNYIIKTSTHTYNGAIRVIY